MSRRTKIAAKFAAGVLAIALVAVAAFAIKSPIDFVRDFRAARALGAHDVSWREIAADVDGAFRDAADAQAAKLAGDIDTYHNKIAKEAEEHFFPEADNFWVKDLTQTGCVLETAGDAVGGLGRAIGEAIKNRSLEVFADELSSERPGCARIEDAIESRFAELVPSSKDYEKKLAAIFSRHFDEWETAALGELEGRLQERGLDRAAVSAVLSAMTAESGANFLGRLTTGRAPIFKSEAGKFKISHIIKHVAVDEVLEIGRGRRLATAAMSRTAARAAGFVTVAKTAVRRALMIWIIVDWRQNNLDHAEKIAELVGDLRLELAADKDALIKASGAANSEIRGQISQIAEVKSGASAPWPLVALLALVLVFLLLFNLGGFRRFNIRLLSTLSVLTLMSAFGFFVFAVGASESDFTRLFGGDSLKLKSGEYLAFLVGVPVAVSTSIIAALIAGATHDSTTAQARMQSIDLLDRKLTEAMRPLVAVINAFTSIDESGDRIARSLEYWRGECGDDSKRYVAIFETGPIDAKDVALREARNDLHEETVRLSGAVKDLHSNIANITDPFWLSAIELQHRSQPSGADGWNRILVSMIGKSSLPQEAAALSTPQNVAHKLGWLAERTQPHESFDAFHLTPSDATSLEIAGAMIWLTGEDLEPAYHFEADYAGKVLNLGTALLIAIYSFVPTRKAILEAAQAAFPLLKDEFNSGKYFSSLPDKSMMIGYRALRHIKHLSGDPRLLTYAMGSEAPPTRLIPLERNAAATMSMSRKPIREEGLNARRDSLAGDVRLRARLALPDFARPRRIGAKAAASSASPSFI